MSALHAEVNTGMGSVETMNSIVELNDAGRSQLVSPGDAAMTRCTRWPELRRDGLCCYEGRVPSQTKRTKLRLGFFVSHFG